MGKLLTIRDVAEDEALVAIRASILAHEAGYHDFIRVALERLGLAHYDTGRTQRRAGIDPAALDELMADIRAKLADFPTRGDGNHYAADAAYNTADMWKNSLYEAVRTGRVAIVTPEIPAAPFNADELTTRYGRSGAMPRPAGDQEGTIIAQRKAMLASFAETADSQGLCSDYERHVVAAGLGAYMPNRELEVSAEVPGIGTVTATVRPMRSGKVDAYTVKEVLRQAAQIKFREMVNALDASAITGIPEGTLV